MEKPVFYMISLAQKYRMRIHLCGNKISGNKSIAKLIDWFTPLLFPKHLFPRILSLVHNDTFVISIIHSCIYSLFYLMVIYILQFLCIYSCECFLDFLTKLASDFCFVYRVFLCYIAPIIAAVTAKKCKYKSYDYTKCKYTKKNFCMVIKKKWT